MKKRSGKKGHGEGRACWECGTSPMTITTGNHRYMLADDWGATLEGVEYSRCEKCGTGGVTIDRPLPLQRAIAAAVVRKPTRLAAQEVKFLRVHLDMQAKELASILGVRKEAMSRWENGKEKIGTVPDRLLRTVVLLADGGEDQFDPRQLAAIVEGDGPMRLTVRMRDGHWEARPAGKAA